MIYFGEVGVWKLCPRRLDIANLILFRYLNYETPYCNFLTAPSLVVLHLFSPCSANFLSCFSQRKFS